MAQPPQDELAQLRQANLLLQQQFAVLLAGQATANPSRRRYIDPPPADAPDDAHLLPEDHRRGHNYARLPIGGAGNSGEPHLLDLQSDPAYAHAVERGREAEAITYRALVSALTYHEVTETALQGAKGRLAELADVSPGIRDAVAIAYPEPVVPAAEGEEREAAIAVAESRANLLARLATVERRVTDIADLIVRLTGTVAGVRVILAHGEGLARSQLAPQHLIPRFLRDALLSGEQVAAHFSTSSDALRTQADKFRTEYAHLASKEAARRAAGGGGNNRGRGGGRGDGGGRGRRSGKEAAESSAAKASK